jgi:hypothetical protein
MTAQRDSHEAQSQSIALTNHAPSHILVRALHASWEWVVSLHQSSRSGVGHLAGL